MPTYVLDVETYKDFWMVLFKRVGSDETVAFELFEGQELDVDGLSKMMEDNLTIGFNSNDYDLFMISGAINGKSNEELKKISDKIITGSKPGWMVAGNNDCEIPRKPYGGTLWNHIDIISVAPGQASLKIYGGRINAPKMQDLPIDPSASISPAQREELRTYCLNDLETTELLYKTLSKQLKLRRDMSKQYKMDLRSKSDAQIAEAVFRKEIGQLDGRQVLPPKRINRTKRYRYLDPKIIEFRSTELQQTLKHIIETEFTLTEKASIQLPKWLSEKKIEIGTSKYQMGIGGLHSCEKKRHVICDDDHVLRDADVASYYPSIILQQGLIPENIGKGFVDVYTNIYDTRLAAKARAGQLVKRLKELEKELAEARAKV